MFVYILSIFCFFLESLLRVIPINDAITISDIDINPPVFGLSLIFLAPLVPSPSDAPVGSSTLSAISSGNLSPEGPSSSPGSSPSTKSFSPSSSGSISNSALTPATSPSDNAGLKMT